MKRENISKKFHWQALASSGGTLQLSLYFPDLKELDKDKKEKALASALTSCHKFMLSKGYIPPEANFMSPSDVAKEYGKTRQYWEKLINEGKIPYKETSAGRITTDLWVQGYLDNREAVDEYTRNCNRVIQSILSQKRNQGRIECPKCGKLTFDYNVNINNINGLCRAECGFRIHTII
jgi:hypothetical protein